MTPGETGGYEEVLVLIAPQAAIQFFVCFAAYGALQFISTCLAPGFTRGHSCIAPSERQPSVTSSIFCILSLLRQAGQLTS